jgi:hypothetical protein
MKRIVFFVMVALLVTAALTAQSYTVQSVTGRVQREAGSNRVDIVTGEVLSANTVIHTGIGAGMVLINGEDTFNIPSAQNGKSVVDLVSASAGMRISGNVAQTDTNVANRTTGLVLTNTARAADAAADDDIAAE